MKEEDVKLNYFINEYEIINKIEQHLKYQIKEIQLQHSFLTNGI